MKHNLHRVLALCLATLLFLGAAIYTVAAAAEDPAVIFYGNTQEIRFERALPFLGNQQPDLFKNLKGLMPGDTVTQQIEVGAKKLLNSRVYLYLRAENPNEDYITLVETYGHWVEFKVKNGNQEITGNLADGVLLGVFSRDDTQTIEVTVSIDIEAGNELQDLVAEIDWVFTAEIFQNVFPPIRPDPDVEPSDLPWLTDDHVNYIIGYSDGLVHPERSMTRAEAATVFYRLLTEEVRDQIWSDQTSYSDVNSESWFYIAICTLTNGGVLKGYPDGTFRPDAPITRAELATIISRFDTKFGELEVTASFDDVTGHWSEPYVEFSATRGYVLGYPDGTFRPDQPITRAETVTMINRCLDRAVDEKGLCEGYITWPDNIEGDWYYYDIIEAANHHDYARSKREVEQQDYCYENWTKLQSPIDWKKHETEWLRDLVK